MQKLINKISANFITPMQNTITNLNKIAFIFFAIIGLTHIIAGLMLINNYLPGPSLIVHRSLDIPFIIIGIIYGFSGLYLKSEPKNSHKIIIGLIAVTIITLAILLYINFFISDRPLIINS